MPGGKVDEDGPCHVRLQKSPNHVVVFQPVVSEEGVALYKSSSKKPGNADGLHDKVISEVVGELVNLCISLSHLPSICQHSAKVKVFSFWMTFNIFFVFNTTLHPKSPLKISNSHRFVKTYENLAQISNSHRFVKIGEK